jgi:hypothetical protein
MVLSVGGRKLIPVIICVAAGVVLGVGFAVTLSANAQSGETILTGQWTYSTRMGPIPLGSDSHCLTQKDVDNFNRGICMKHYTCDYETAIVSNGQVNLKGTWTDKKGNVSAVTARGQYTPESFSIDVHGQMLSATMSAHRTSATCAAN